MRTQKEKDAVLHIVDVNVTERCVFPRPSRPALTKREVGPIEEGWINYQPYFKTPVAEHTLPTVGTTKPLDPLARFATRVAEWQHIEATQGLELETVAQELARTGLASSSLDASRGDDEYGPSLADAIGPRDPVPYVAPSDALVRRIEWERFMLASGQPLRIFWGPDPETGELAALSDQPKKKLSTSAILAGYAKQLVAVRQGRSLAELINDRERVAFYGGIGSLLYGIAHGEHPESTPLNDIPLRDQPDAEDGPKELALDEAKDPNEPTETDLWPVTMREVRRTLRRRLPLSQPEWRWLATHPENARKLRLEGFVF